MNWIIAGLGNPDTEHAGERHNTGRMLIQTIAKKEKLEWDEDQKTNALITKYGFRKPATFVLPETYMNKSGVTVSKFVKSVKAAEKLLIVYDDLDLSLGKMKISYDRSSGGHRGLQSVERAIKTKKFWRLRIGISPSTSSGKLKKPVGEKAVIDFILGKFKPTELETLKKVFRRGAEAIETIVSDGPEKAMNELN